VLLSGVFDRVMVIRPLFYWFLVPVCVLSRQI